LSGESMSQALPDSDAYGDIRATSCASAVSCPTAALQSAATAYAFSSTSVSLW